MEHCDFYLLRYLFLLPSDQMLKLCPNGSVIHHPLAFLPWFECNYPFRFMCLKTWFPAGDSTAKICRTFRKWSLAGENESLSGGGGDSET